MAFLHANDEYRRERIQYDECDVSSLLLNKLLWCICLSQPYNSIGNSRSFSCKFAAGVKGAQDCDWWTHQSHITDGFFFTTKEGN